MTKSTSMVIVKLDYSSLNTFDLLLYLLPLIMGSVAQTTDVFLWSMSVIYLFAFSSLYVQIPGLYGDNGLMPAWLVNKEAKSLNDLLKDPSLLKLLPKYGIDTQTGMDMLCLLGILISLFCMVSHNARNFINFIFLWVLYLSLYQVGQTFMWFQWDILLLEAGFLTLLVAPFALPFIRKRSSVPHDHITLWLVRWLLFRLMFASGVVKLTSRCPTWWGLTALTVHFESQCIPNPVAWYWHHFPEWFLKLSCVATYVIEIGFPFLFFAPVHSLRIISFYSQVLLQVLIILTGNFNFFNLLTIALCIPLLDDEALGINSTCKGKRPSILWSFILSVVIPGIALGIIAYLTWKLFKVEITPDYSMAFSITFSEKEFFDWLEQIMPWTMKLGAASLAMEIVVALVRSWTCNHGSIRKNMAVAQSLFFGVIAVAMFCISLVPYAAVHKPMQQSLHPELQSLYSQVHSFRLASSYGLFRRMTGVGGRPEVIIEGSYNRDSGWKEYNFLYKPGSVSSRPPVVAPHQPRLDWQMWFAALGNYQHNPWFITLVYRLLTNQPEVLELMGENPFPDQPPTFVRASLYHYHYTSNDPKNKHYSRVNWWWRSYKAEYFPVMSKDFPTLLEFLRHYKILENVPKPPPPTFLIRFVKWIRLQVGQPEGFTFIASIFFSGLFIIFINVVL